jgi:hypothetical protein
MTPHPWWNGYWYAFVNGYMVSSFVNYKIRYGPWGNRYGSIDVLERPAAPPIWHEINERLLSRWSQPALLPSGLIDRGMNISPSTPYVDYELSKIQAWSDFGRVQTTSYGLWQAEIGLLKALLQPATLDADAYFFVLHLLAGIVSGHPDAQQLAARIVAAPTTSPEYGPDTFINQVMYLILIFLVDPLGMFHYDNAALQQFVASLAAVVTLKDPASIAIRQSLATQAQRLQADATYPMQDSNAPNVTLAQRRLDTLAALDQARASLQS